MEDVSHIPFQICNIFNDVSNQYWSTNWLFTEVLYEHAPLKERTIKEDQVPYMHSNLRKEMYKRNMLKNKHLNDRGNQIKRNQYTKQRNKVTAMRQNAIRDYFMSKCKSDASPKDFWNAVDPFLTSKHLIRMKYNTQRR